MLNFRSQPRCSRHTHPGQLNSPGWRAVKRWCRTLACVALGFAALPTAAEELVVHCLGGGPPVYLIGGGPAFTTWHLQPVQTRLSSRLRVCRWDMRGVGDNERLPVDPQAPALSQWLEDMNRVIPHEPVVLWGHSWGALQAILFARRYPNRVSKLILSNPVDPALLSLKDIERKRFDHPDLGGELELDDMGTPAETLHSLRRKIASYFVDARQGWAFAAEFSLQDSNGELNVRIWRDYRASPLNDADIERLAGKVAGAVHCEHDVLQPEALGEYARLLGSEKNHVVTNCAHFPWEENPPGYFMVLSRLLAEQ